MPGREKILKSRNHSTRLRRSTVRRAPLLLWVVAGSVLAQPADDAALPSLDQLLAVKVFTASRFPQALSDAPSAVSIITAEDIKTYGYHSLADVLRAVRGLHVTYDRNYSYLGTRGFAPPGDYNSRILILVDGFRLNNGTYDETPIGHDLPIDLESIERVEFVSGPGSAVFGGNAFFGVLNLITRKGEAAAGRQVIAEAGSHRAARGYAGIGAARSDGDGWRLSASYANAPGADLAFPEFADAATGSDGIARGMDGERYVNVYGQGSLGPFSFLALADRRTKGIPTASYGQSFGATPSQTIDERRFIGFTYASPLAADLELTAQLSLGSSDYHGVYYFDTPTPRNLNYDSASSRWWSVEVRALYTGWRAHRIVFGADVRGDTRIRQYSYDDTGVLTDDARRRTSVGIYVQDEWALAEAWLLNLGLRVDHTSGESTATNPRLGLIYKPDPKTAVKLLYGTAYRNPNAYEAHYYENQGSQPALAAEHIRSGELVAEHFVDSSWKLTATAFTYRLRNLLVLDADPETGLLFYRNSAPIRGSGVELESTNFFECGAQLRAGYSYQRVSDSASGPQPNAPRHLAKLNFSTPLPGAGARLGVEVQATGPRYRITGEQVGGFALANLTLSSIRLGPRLELNGGVGNLLDHRYRDPEGLEHVDALGRRLSGIEQDGRHWWLGLAYAF